MNVRWLFCIQIGNLPGVYNFVLKGGDFRERAEKSLQLLSNNKVSLICKCILMSYSILLYL